MRRAIVVLALLASAFAFGFVAPPRRASAASCQFWVNRPYSSYAGHGGATFGISCDGYGRYDSIKGTVWWKCGSTYCNTNVWGTASLGGAEATQTWITFPIGYCDSFETYAEPSTGGSLLTSAVWLCP